MAGDAALIRLIGKFLAELQADGRMTNVELAKRVGISATPWLASGSATLEESAIPRLHANVNARELRVRGYRCLRWSDWPSS